jgi:putative endopeptidase
MMQGQWLIGALLAIALAGCTEKPVDSKEAEASAPLVSGIDLQYIDPSVPAGDNFFAYVNGKWLETAEIPADKSRYGTFDILRDEARANVRQIIERAAEGDFPQGSDEQRVGDLYASFLDTTTRDAKGLTPLQPELDAIDAIHDMASLTRYMGGASRRGYSVPFGIFQLPDPKDPTIYALVMFQSGLGLPDREYYLKDDERSESLREAYEEHIETMFKLAGLAEGEDAAETILALETRMAEQNMRKEDFRDWAANYNKVNSDELPALIPSVDWTGYWSEQGYSEPPAYVVALTIDYLRALETILIDTPLETWKTYLRWSVLNGAASRLTTALDEQNFAFYGRTLSGTEEQEAPWKRAVNLVNNNLGEIVGKVYVKEHFPPEAKARMTELVANLIEAYRVSITELDWMGEETKKEALDKLSKFRPKIGYPDTWIDYSPVTIEADDLFGNLARITEFDHQRYLARHDGPVDKEEWAMTPQTVNAYYRNTLNEIVFPAAILQPPFFNLEADEAVNYGGIGAVIGHEIGHGFDDSGSQFDGDGVLRNWWTDDDRVQFEARTKALIEQYNAFKPFDDLSVNGEFTLGENIGDLGGISIALLAYELSLNGQAAPVIDDLTGVQRVFLGFAQVWRGKYREERLRQQIATDPHSPPEYRANGPVRNVDAWYEVFGVTPEHALYLPPAERVKIW